MVIHSRIPAYEKRQQVSFKPIPKSKMSPNAQSGSSFVAAVCR